MIKLNLPKKEHDSIIENAKKLLEKRQELKWEICKLALRICYIPDKKGGRYDNRYSITNFATDIGMSRKTLNCWILDYKAIFLKLEIDINGMNFSEMKKLNSTISKTRVKIFNNKGNITISDFRDVPKEKIQTVFQETMQTDNLTHRLEANIKNIKHHIYTFTHEEFNKKLHSSLIEKYKLNLKALNDAVKIIKIK